MENINKSVATLLCDTIRRENAGKWYTPGGLTCWYCLRSSKGNQAKMRMSHQNGYRGCRLVNDWYTKLKGDKAREKILKLQ